MQDGGMEMEGVSGLAKAAGDIGLLLCLCYDTGVQVVGVREDWWEMNQLSWPQMSSPHTLIWFGRL